MSLLAEAKEWVESNSPDPDDTRQTVDNLAHQYGVAEPGKRIELMAAITYLCSLLTVDPASVVLPTDPGPQKQCDPDLSPLGNTDGAEGPVVVLTAAEKAARFKELRESLQMPF